MLGFHNEIRLETCYVVVLQNTFLLFYAFQKNIITKQQHLRPIRALEDIQKLPHSSCFHRILSCTIGH